MTFPGRIFLSHFPRNFDTGSELFQSLQLMDVGIRDPYDGVSHDILRNIFPMVIIL